MLVQHAPAKPLSPLGLQDLVRGLLVGLAFIVPLIGGQGTVAQLGNFSVNLPSPGTQLGLLALILCFLTVLTLLPVALGRQNPRLYLTTVDWAALAFLAFSTLAVIWAPYQRAARFSVLQVLLYLLCFWLARGLLTTDAWRRRVMVALVSGGCLVSLIGLGEFTRTWRYEHNTAWRIFATFNNPNLTASFLVVLLPLAVALAVEYLPAREDQHPGGRPLTLAAVLLMFLALVLTGSKGGWLSALAAAAVMGWHLARRQSSRRLRRWTIVIVLGALLLAVLLPPIRSRLAAASSTQFNSTAFRYYLWTGMLKMVAARPLTGFGAGSFQWAFGRFAVVGVSQLGHNAYLQVATETGLPGALAYLALWIALVTALLRRLRQTTSPTERGWRAAALAGLTGFLIQNAVDNNWYCPAIIITLFLLTGAMLASPTPPASSPRRPSWLLSSTALAAMLALLALMAWFTSHQLPAQRYETEALAASHDPDLAATLARRAVALDPGDAQLYFPLSDILASRGTPGATREALETRLAAAGLLPVEAGNWRRLALLYAQFNQADSALACARRALELYPAYPLGLLTQARVAEFAGRSDLVDASFRQLSALYDTPLGKYSALGDLIDPTFLYAWQYLAQQAKHRGDREAALANWRKMAGLLTRYWQLDSLQLALMRSIQLASADDEQAFAMMTLEVVDGLRSSGRPDDAAQANQLLDSAAKGEKRLQSHYGGSYGLSPNS